MVVFLSDRLQGLPWVKKGIAGMVDCCKKLNLSLVHMKAQPSVHIMKWQNDEFEHWAMTFCDSTVLF